MSRDAAGQAQKTFQTAQQVGSTSADNSNSLYNQLTPAYTSEAVNPQGFGDKTLADMTTGAEQSVGGSQAGTVGEAATRAAANHNLGSFAPALDESSRDASKVLSGDTLGIKKDNAMLQEGQRQAGLSGLQSLQNQDNSDVLSSLGIENGSTDALNKSQPGWFQNFTTLLATLGKNSAGASDAETGGE